MQRTELVSRVEELRGTFDKGVTRTLEWRERQLERLAAMIDRHEPRFIEALEADLGKCRFETTVTETAFLRGEVDYVRTRLRRWARPQRVWTPLHSWPGRSRVTPQPLGTILILSPWNYPLTLCLSPLIGALAAGNCVAIKPSEIAPRASAAIAEAVTESLDPSAVQVFSGGPSVAEQLLDCPFDHIFFTGSQRVGKLVMRAAAEKLTPVTLELGGKSPCIVDAGVDLQVTARRIAWGKFLNAGQTCVAPDYLLVHHAAIDRLLDELAEAVRDFYGPDPRRSPDLARIVNDVHFRRLAALLEDGERVVGGESDAASRYIAPTILRDVPADSPLMTEEIFGPILPVVPVADMEEAVRFVRERPSPLALYLFTTHSDTRRLVLERTPAGGVCVNDVVMQLAVPELPFGGVGASGMGSYHGRATFDTFSHLRSELIKTTRFDIPLRYPPYSDKKLKWLKWFL